nr:unnamed protein product [Callosobruchus analis]
MAGYTLQLLVFLGLVCLTYQQKNLIRGDLSRYGAPSDDLKPGYEIYFEDELGDKRNDENVANAEMPRGLVTGLLSKVSNVTGAVTGVVTDGIPNIADLINSTVNITSLLKRLLSFTDIFKNGLDLKAIWEKVVGFLRTLPVFAKISIIIDSVREACKCIKIAIINFFNNFLGLECTAKVVKNV